MYLIKEKRSSDSAISSELISDIDQLNSLSLNSIESNEKYKYLLPDATFSLRNLVLNASATPSLQMESVLLINTDKYYSRIDYKIMNNRMLAFLCDAVNVLVSGQLNQSASTTFIFEQAMPFYLNSATIKLIDVVRIIVFFFVVG